MTPFLAALCAVAFVSALTLWRRQVGLRREAFIREFEFPRGLFEQLRKRRPDLTLKDCQLVSHALRQFFLAHLKSGRRYVSMPSQVVDELWHEFILHTKNYQLFCRRAFGRFLHHTPAVALGSAYQSNVGLRRCFWHTCRDESINPRQPTRLPLLFAIDAKLNIPDGFRYVRDCSALRRGPQSTGGAAVYCGGDFTNPSFDGGTDGLGGAADAGSGGDSGGDGGGCGGGGCGGGD